jgi:hypothetical protein
MRKEHRSRRTYGVDVTGGQRQGSVADQLAGAQVGDDLQRRAIGTRGPPGGGGDGADHAAGKEKQCDRAAVGHDTTGGSVGRNRQ